MFDEGEEDGGDEVADGITLEVMCVGESEGFTFEKPGGGGLVLLLRFIEGVSWHGEIAQVRMREERGTASRKRDLAG